MNLNINAIEMCTDIPECMMPEEVRHVAQVDDHINLLTIYVINEWLSTRTEVQAELWPYWPF